MKTKYKTAVFSIIFFFINIHFVYATSYEIPQLSKVVSNITDTIVWVIATLLVLFIISFGVQFILSSDSPQERLKLRNKIIWSIVGLFIILSAKPISLWLQSLIQ